MLKWSARSKSLSTAPRKKGYIFTLPLPLPLPLPSLAPGFAARNEWSLGTDNERMTMRFDFQKLEVYQKGLDFVVVADEIIGGLPKGRAYLADQLRRAASSIALNVAEGAGEFSPNEKARF